MKWDTVIGLEVHVQLKTKSKLFSGAATTFGATPNSQTSFIDAGLPGVLPVPNQQAIFMAIQFGLAIGAEINNLSYFERKNYFYPDLPKGYQISQYQRPIVANGFLRIEEGKQIPIIRAHLEEDAGKSLHQPDYTGIDLNRAGNPLLEVVTAPCLASATEAIHYLKTLHRLVRFLGICDGNLQEGSFRCDVNISLKPQGSNQLGTRVELKNLNSFRFIEKAIYYEQMRQQASLASGQRIQQETRFYCPETHTTQTLRSKENVNDYRYFPDPDLLPIAINAQDLATIKQAMPPLPDQIAEELTCKGLHKNDIDFLLSSPATFHFYNELKQASYADEKMIINWLKGEVTAALNDANRNFENSPLSALALAPLLNQLMDKKISGKIAKQIFAKLWNGEGTVEAIIRQEGYSQVSNESLTDIVVATIKAYPQQVADYHAGKEKIFAFFVGQIMKQTKGQAAPEEINQLLKKHLSASSRPIC